MGGGERGVRSGAEREYNIFLVQSGVEWRDAVGEPEGSPSEAL